MGDWEEEWVVWFMGKEEGKGEGGGEGEGVEVAEMGGEGVYQLYIMTGY